MTNIAFNKKILGKTTQKAFNQRSSFTNVTLQSEALNPPADENCIPVQGERGRVIVFIDGSNLFYAASQLSIEIDYVKLLHYLTARNCLVHVFLTNRESIGGERMSLQLLWLLFLCFGNGSFRGEAVENDASNQ